ncbi:hypothetical protein CLV58_11399 [Spirosoma oryzae]|uniref:Uncharacterized protein n=1 Tax=Spirosoma oryzae TaxID=1469603 RepID=A0A2T0SRC7_9BACT|nr:hypothetical protein [Spirosoma oryzae]PRY35971.1 hypothetical protein CLV58_11399 [Spirosoma oryzae]
MQTVYINYPEPHITRYTNVDSRQIRKHGKEEQRYIRITHTTLSEELSKFKRRVYKFGSKKAINDMYIDLDLNDPEFELAVLKHIQQLIGKHYKPLSPIRTSINKA